MKALVIVDMENDFMPGGALGVKGGDDIVPLINDLIPKFPLVVACRDWHPSDHVSFAASHPGKKVGDRIHVKGKEQVLWPVHCVRDTLGAEIVSSLNQEEIVQIFSKGTEKDIDSYSAFFDNAHLKSTGLGEYLRVQNVHEVYLAGLTTEYCILYSALDALDLGFAVYVIIDACRPINLKPRDDFRAIEMMTVRGANIITCKDLS